MSESPNSPDHGRLTDVLFVRPTLGQGGADKVTLTILEKLDRSCFQPRLALFHRQGEWLDSLPKDVPAIDLGGRSLWSVWLPLAKLLTATRPDVVFSTSSGANLAACLAHLVARSPARLVLSERSMLMRPSGGLKRLLLFAAKAILYHRADLVTTVSGAVARDVQRRLRLDPNSTAVVLNPVADVDQAVYGRAAPHPWLDATEPVILAAGRLVGVKDFGTLIRALEVTLRQCRCRLIILGDGPERASLLGLAEKLGISERVRILGFRKDIFAFMRACQLFALSSRIEGLPGVLIQAMACGAPVVSTDYPGAREIIRNDREGLVVPVGDVAGLSTAMTSVLLDASLRRTLTENGLRASRRFQAAEIMPLYEAAILGQKEEGQ